MKVTSTIILFWFLTLAPLTAEAERARFLEPAEDFLFASEWEQRLASAVREVLLEDVVGEPLVRAMQREAFRGGGKIQLAPGDGSKAAVNADAEVAGRSPGKVESQGATLLAFAQSALDCGSLLPLFFEQPAAQAGPAGWPIESGSRLPQSKEDSPRNAGRAISHSDRNVDESASEGRPAAGNPSVASSTTLGQLQNAVAEDNGVILLVTAPERWAIAEEFNVRVLLINQTRRPVVSILVDGWYDLNPAMVDEDGRSVPLTEYGRRKLGEREIFRRRRLGVMEPGNFLSWNVDLSKAFKPEPGILELSLTVKYRFRDSDLASGLNSLKIDGISIEAVSDRASITEGKGGRNLGRKGEMDFAALKGEYAGRIDTRVRGPARVEVMRALGNLMQEWSPVGHSREEVISLMGSPTHESDKELTADMNPRERYLVADDRDIDLARRKYVRDLRERHGDPGERADHHDPLLGYRYALRANRIFREWNPIGFISDDLRTVLGEPHRKVEANERYFALLWEYDFVVGPAGAHWRIGIDANNRIVAIEYIPGE